MRVTFPAGTLAIAVPHSQNAKLGEAATTYASQGSCPTDCPFFDGGGCYAESGAVGKFVTKPLNEAAGQANSVAIAQAEGRAIDAMELVPGRPMRLHTVGDCATDEAACIVSAAAERYMARGGGPVWTYTHGWRVVGRASWGKVSVLASCETPMDVALASARGYATALVVEEFLADQRYEVRGGDSSGTGVVASDILPCPAQTRRVSCSDCQLCFNDEGIRERGYAIGFELHGIPFAVRAARAALRDPDDPLRRLASEERIRLIRERVLAAEGREVTVREVAEEIPDLARASIYEWLRYHRGEIEHPAERRRKARQAKKIADALLREAQAA